MSTTPLLETRNLNMRFGGVHATRDVNFKLSDGELRCIIGPNGAGKSTFFKQLTGQLPAKCCFVVKTSQAASRMCQRV